MADAVQRILHPVRLVTSMDALSRSTPIPKSPGVYGWYFDAAPGGVPIDDGHRLGGRVLLYSGISPRRPRDSDGRASAGHLRKRIRNHYKGDASRSTLRLSLGSLLSGELGISLQVAKSSPRFTFGEGEQLLSEWMSVHTRVCWAEHPEPWLVEDALIATVPLKLNLDGNASGDFFMSLKAARKSQRDHALASIAPTAPSAENSGE